MYKEYEKKLRGSNDEDYREFLKRFLSLFVENGCRSVLDIGSGNSAFLDILAESELRGVGIEIEPEFVKDALFLKNQIRSNAEILTTLEGLLRSQTEAVMQLNDLVSKFINAQDLLLRNTEVVSFMVRNALRPNDICVVARKPPESKQ